MTSRSPAAATLQVALRAACLLAVLVGIFGMQGLTNHGAGQRMEDMPSVLLAETTVRTLAAADAVSDWADADVGAVSVDGADTAFAVGAAEHGGMDMSTMCLCLTFIILSLGAACLWLRRHRRLRPDWVLPRLIGTIERVGRDLEPPSLHRLSIQRC